MKQFALVNHRAKRMTQYGPGGKFIRSALYNPALYSIWMMQVPFGRIDLE